MAGHRPERLAELIRQELARLLREDLRDPRVGDISITHVQVTRDLRVATVRYVPLGGERSAGPAQGKALEGAVGFLRTRLAQVLRLRHTPQLEFRLDTTLEKAFAVSALLMGLELPPEHDDAAPGPEGGEE